MVKVVGTDARADLLLCSRKTVLFLLLIIFVGDCLVFESRTIYIVPLGHIYTPT